MSLSRHAGSRIAPGIRIKTWDPQRLGPASALNAKSLGKQATGFLRASPGLTQTKDSTAKLAKPSESLAAFKDAGNSDDRDQEGTSGGKGLAKMVSGLEM
jgi:hypothetical protein